MRARQHTQVRLSLWGSAQPASRWEPRRACRSLSCSAASHSVTPASRNVWDAAARCATAHALVAKDNMPPHSAGSGSLCSGDVTTLLLIQAATTLASPPALPAADSEWIPSRRLRMSLNAARDTTAATGLIGLASTAAGESAPAAAAAAADEAGSAAAAADPGVPYTNERSDCALEALRERAADAASAAAPGATIADGGWSAARRCGL